MESPKLNNFPQPAVTSQVEFCMALVGDYDTGWSRNELHRSDFAWLWSVIIMLSDCTMYTNGRIGECHTEW